MIVAVKKTVYPNGQEIERNGSMKVELDQAPNTREFNKFFERVYRNLRKEYRCNSRNR